MHYCSDSQVVSIVKTDRTGSDVRKGRVPRVYIDDQILMIQRVNFALLRRQ
ncbi:hypothetical protein GPB2148_3215 [marine gamma proteobacterium HTCC2148]|nr:hypothetical protein GPB2148_3215 [marine gamma proteobacterium HTCC2148]